MFGAPDTTIALSRVSPPAPPADVAVATLTVRPQELDPMDHVNNAVYADWLDEQVIGAGGRAAVRAVPRTIRLIRPRRRTGFRRGGEGLARR